MGGFGLPRISEISTTVSLIDPHARFTRDINLPSTYLSIIEYANSDSIFFDLKIESLIFERYFFPPFLVRCFFFGTKLRKAHCGKR